MTRFFNVGQDSSPRKTLCQLLKLMCTKFWLISIPILCLCQLTGSYAMDTYTEHIINIAIPHYGRVVISCVNVVSVGACLFMIDNVDRRSMLTISVLGSAMCCFVIAIYRLVEEDQYRDSSRSHLVVPVVMVVIYYIVCSLGIMPILPVLTGEIFPRRVKTIAISFCIMFVYVTEVAVDRLYSLLHVKTGECLTFVVFAFCGSVGMPLAMLSLPETRGKSLSQIQDEFEDVLVVLS